MNIEDKVTLNYIIKTSKTDIDLRWKLGKYIENGDVSFLGKSIEDLKKEIIDASRVTSSVESD